MIDTEFRRKYLGELTLRNGAHVKFLYPITKADIALVSEQASQDWELAKNGWLVQDDNLTKEQYIGVIAGQNKYGTRYWNTFKARQDARNRKEQQLAIDHLNQYQKPVKTPMEDISNNIDELRTEVANLEQEIDHRLEQPARTPDKSVWKW